MARASMIFLVSLSALFPNTWQSWSTGLQPPGTASSDGLWVCLFIYLLIYVLMTLNVSKKLWG